MILPKMTLRTLLGLLATAALVVRGEDNCNDVCAAAYSETAVAFDLCVNACDGTPELFHVDFPYLIGPLTLQPYPELTNSDPLELKNLTGELWARVNTGRNQMQFYYQMSDNPEPFFPYFA